MEKKRNSFSIQRSPPSTQINNYFSPQTNNANNNNSSNNKQLRKLPSTAFKSPPQKKAFKFIKKKRFGRHNSSINRLRMKPKPRHHNNVIINSNSRRRSAFMKKEEIPELFFDGIRRVSSHYVPSENGSICSESSFASSIRTNTTDIINETDNTPSPIVVYKTKIIKQKINILNKSSRNSRKKENDRDYLKCCCFYW